MTPMGYIRVLRLHRRGGGVIGRVGMHRSGGDQAHRQLESGMDGSIHVSVDWKKGTAHVRG
jgi:hypothetical protein